MGFDTSYLNRTANKWPRTGGTQQIELVVWHETASPSPDNPKGTLNYNLPKAIQSSYNYLIARNGTIYHYIDERLWISYHAGLHSAARGYIEWQVNVRSLGVELDGRNDGTPITAAQRDAAIQLMIYFRNSYGIPIEREYHLHHKEVAPGYKSDPRGYSATTLVDLARKQAPTLATPPPPPDAQVIGVKPVTTLKQFQASLDANKAPLSTLEQQRVYTAATWLEIEPAFFIALWAHEGGRPLGSSPLQQKTHCPINIKAARDEWRPTIDRDGVKWLAFESFQLGSLQSLIHLKQVHGAAGRLTLRQLIPVHAPSSDGNDPETFIASVLDDMKFIQART